MFIFIYFSGSKTRNFRARVQDKNSNSGYLVSVYGFFIRVYSSQTWVLELELNLGTWASVKVDLACSGRSSDIRARGQVYGYPKSTQVIGFRVVRRRLSRVYRSFKFENPSSVIRTSLFIKNGCRKCSILNCVKSRRVSGSRILSR